MPTEQYNPPKDLKEQVERLEKYVYDFVAKISDRVSALEKPKPEGHDPTGQPKEVCPDCGMVKEKYAVCCESVARCPDCNWEGRIQDAIDHGGCPNPNCPTKKQGE